MDGAQDSDLLKTVPNYDKMKELQAFDATKAGVKGLLDSGIVKIPKIFIRPPEELSEELNHRPSNIELPVIDFDGLHRADQRSKIVDQLKIASQKWGFFQVINHGIPMSVLDNMINGVQRFHEQDQEVKKQYYTRDHIARKIRYNSNYDLYKSRTANWRDTLMFSLPGSYQLDPSELPIACSFLSKCGQIRCKRPKIRRSKGMLLFEQRISPLQLIVTLSIGAKKVKHERTQFREYCRAGNGEGQKDARGLSNS